MTGRCCKACGAPCFIHHCYYCHTDDPLAAEPQKQVARLAREHAAVTEELKRLKVAVHELIAAESSQTKGAYNLDVKGAAREKLMAEEGHRLTAAWIAVDKLSAES